MASDSNSASLPPLHMVIEALHQKKVKKCQKSQDKVKTRLYLSEVKLKQIQQAQKFRNKEECENKARILTDLTAQIFEKSWRTVIGELESWIEMESSQLFNEEFT